MKNLIKNILKEESKLRGQWSPEATQDLESFHPDLFELGEQDDFDAGALKTQDEVGGWNNPISR